MTGTNLRVIAVLACLIPVALGGARHARAHDGYVFGVLPYLPAARLEGVFAPLAGELGAALGARVHYRSAPTFEDFMDRLGKGAYDFAFIQPFDYVRIAKGAGYAPLVRRREPLYAVFVVREGSLLKDVRELRGAQIAMPPRVAALTYLGRAELRGLGLAEGVDYTASYTQGHHECIQQAVVGDAVACVTGLPAMRVYEAKTGIGLRAIHRTSEIPSMLIVVHDRVPMEARERAASILLSTTLKGVDADLRGLLMEGPEPPFVRTADEEYGPVRRYWERLGEGR